MKQYIILSFFLLFCSMQITNAQEWFPIGAKWTYSVIYPHTFPPLIDIETVYCKGDTLINGISAKILVGGNTVCSWVIQNENYLYHNKENDVLYMYWDEEFRPLFDFNKNKGETYYSYYYDIDNETGKWGLYAHLITVDTVIVIVLDGVPIRQQFFTSTNNNYIGYKGAAIEFIVNFYSFYPENFGTCDMEQSERLRCFESHYFNYHEKPEYEIYGCDYNLKVNENLPINVITIYPNPATDFIKIKNIEKLNLSNYEIEIFDIMGRRQKAESRKQKAEDEMEIDISHLQAGYYFLKIDNQLFKIIKN